MYARIIKTASATVSLAVALIGCGGDGGATTEEIPSCENRGDMYFAGIAKTTDDGIATVQLTSAAPAPPVPAVPPSGAAGHESTLTDGSTSHFAASRSQSGATVSTPVFQLSVQSAAVQASGPRTCFTASRDVSGLAVESVKFTVGENPSDMPGVGTSGWFSVRQT